MELRIDSPSTGAELAERDSLLGGEVDDDESIDTGILAVIEETGFSVSTEGVVVAHQENGSFQAAPAGVTDHLEGRLHGDAILEGNLTIVSGNRDHGLEHMYPYRVGGLDSWSIRNWVSERHAELDDVCEGLSVAVGISSVVRGNWLTSTTLLHGKENVGGSLRLGKAGGDICDESGLAMGGRVVSRERRW